MAAISQAAQDYLKTIYELTTRYGRATTSQIAAQLQIRPASVTSMVQKLADEERPLLDYHKHQGVTLTADGERAALAVVRQHRLLEVFLHEVLDYGWDEVHEEAERLEHAISPEMEERLDAMLGHPRRDPHGQPIPSPELELGPTADFPMSELRSGQQAVISRVQDEDPALLRYLDAQGLRPQAEVTVLDYVAFDQTLHLQVNGQQETAVLGPQITNELFVELLPANPSGAA